MRSDARVNAFSLIFESLFHECDEELSKENLPPLKREADEKFCQQIMSAFNENRMALKEKIEANLKNFEYDRLFKADLALVYLALTEVFFCGTPKAVAVNEVLEIAKRYSTSKSNKFINGLVSSIVNEQQNS